MNSILPGPVVCAIIALAPALSHASYGIYVGKNLTADGSVFLAGRGGERVPERVPG